MHLHVNYCVNYLILISYFTKTTVICISTQWSKSPGVPHRVPRRDAIFAPHLTGPGVRRAPGNCHRRQIRRLIRTRPSELAGSWRIGGNLNINQQLFIVGQFNYTPVRLRSFVASFASPIRLAGIERPRFQISLERLSAKDLCKVARVIKNLLAENCTKSHGNLSLSEAKAYNLFLLIDLLALNFNFLWTATRTAFVRDTVCQDTPQDST